MGLFRLRSLIAMLLSLAAPFSLASWQRESGQTQPAPFQWPESGLCRLVIPNGTQYLVDYVKKHPDWFSPGELILCLVVTRQASDSVVELEKQYQSDRQFLDSKHLIVGTYISGTTVVPEADEDSWPNPVVSTEMLPNGVKLSEKWPGARARWIINVADPFTRHALQTRIESAWTKYPAPVRFVDNAGVHRSAGATQPWDGYCQNIKALRQIAEGQRSHVVFNIATHPGAMSVAETDELMDAVGQEGILLEDPWTPYVRKSPVETERAKNRYRQLLDSGMAIVMLVNNVPADALFDWVGTWRKAKDRLYIGVPFFKEPELPNFCRSARPALH
jgi:hypothetical protein